jgi:four helix bundle protein
MKEDDIRVRCNSVAIRIIKVAGSLPEGNYSEVICGQVLRCATAVGANYRAASRAKSRKDFINKLKIVEEELDETLFWLSLIGDTGLLPKEKLQPLMDECNELLAVMVTSIVTARKNERNKKTLKPGISATVTKT